MIIYNGEWKIDNGQLWSSNMNKNDINMKVNEKLSTVNSQLSIVKIQFDSNQDYQLTAVDSIKPRRTWK